MAVIASDLAPKMNNALKMQGINASQITGRSQFTSSLGSQVFSPETQGEFEFTVQPNGFCDMQSMRFEGQLYFTDGVRLTKSIQSLFQTVQIYTPISGDYICNIDQFNVLQSALSDVTFSPIDMEQGTLANTQLYGSDQLREQYSRGVSFSMQLNHDLLKLPSYFPTWLSGGLKIKLFLAPSRSAMIKVDQSLTNFSYKLTNLTCAYDVVSVTSVVQNQYIQAFNNNALQFKIPTWRVSNQTSSAQIETLRITNAGNSNRALLVVPRYISTINSASQDSHGRRTAHTLRQVTVKVGDAVARVHDTTKGSASLVALLQQAIDFTSTSTCINATNYHSELPFTPGSQGDLDRSSKFMLLQSLELDNTDPGVLSGISRQDISIELNYATPLPEPIVYTSFVLVDQIVSLGKDIACKVLS